MEIKINREIRNYTESLFFGLSMRQFIFSALAVAVAVVLYFVLKPILGMETVSWMCILGAAPFAAMGFISYHGMTAEQFLWAWLRSELIEPKEIRFEPVNLYYEAMKDSMHKGKTRTKRKKRPVKRKPGKYLVQKQAGKHTKEAIRHHD